VQTPRRDRDWSALRDRVDVLGGTLDVISRTGRGTRLIALFEFESS
jgi:signal transduction histidine kinase